MAPERPEPVNRPVVPGADNRARRAELRARLAAERAELLCSFLGIETTVLEQSAIVGDRTAAGLLSAVAEQEDSFARALERRVDGASAPSSPRANESGPASFDISLSHCVAARTRFLDALARVPDERIFDAESVSDSTSALSLATQCFWNDASLSVRSASWSRVERLGESAGPTSLLRASARAARKELLTTVSLVPAAAREVPAFEAGRTLPQIFRMISGLERMFLEALAAVGYGRPPAATQRPTSNTDAWRSSWEELHHIHTGVLEALEPLDDLVVERTLTDGDGTAETIYAWARGCLLHDRLHAAHIRADLSLDWPERLLR